ncbi:hypothetical protein ACFX2A_041038 [Malus domestica]
MVHGGNAEEDEDGRRAFFTIAVCHGRRAVETVVVCYKGHHLLRRGVSLVVDGSAVFLAAKALILHHNWFVWLDSYNGDVSSNSNFDC